MRYPVQYHPDVLSYAHAQDHVRTLWVLMAHTKLTQLKMNNGMMLVTCNIIANLRLTDRSTDKMAVWNVIHGNWALLVDAIYPSELGGSCLNC